MKQNIRGRYGQRPLKNKAFFGEDQKAIIIILWNREDSFDSIKALIFTGNALEIGSHESFSDFRA